LKEMWKSPNGTVRTVSFTPSHCRIAFRSYSIRIRSIIVDSDTDIVM